MDATEFIKSKQSTDGNLYPQNTSPQEGLDILIEHFLGKDWIVIDPLSQGQVNTIAIYEILEKTQKKSIFSKIKTFFK